MKRRSRSPARERGLSLVEVMVGLLIGLIGVIVIFQVLAASDARKRSTAAGTDAQIQGAIALHRLQDDIALAGYGFGTAAYMGCTVNAYDSQRPGGNFTFTLAPVQITQGAGGLPDTITALWGDSPLFVANQSFTASTSTTKVTQGRGGLQTGDLLIAAGSGPVCGMVEVTGNTDSDGLTIDHVDGSYTNASGATVNSRYNPSAGLPVAFTSGYLYDLGSSPHRDIWAIGSDDTLTVTDDLAYSDTNGDSVNDATEVASGVIDLQAEYGVDTNNDNMISSGEWTATDPADWSKVRAIRVALLARSGQYEKTQVTTTAPTWDGGTFVMRNVDGTTDTNPTGPNNWRNYRYRVYQTVVPLRNMIWGTSP